MPRLKKRSTNQKIIADRLKTRKRREDENFRKREKQRYLELRLARREKEDNLRKENGQTTQEGTNRHTEIERTPESKKENVTDGSIQGLCAGVKNKSRKSTVKYTFDELLDYIRLSRVRKPVKEETPEEIVVPVDVLNEEGVRIKEEPTSETEDEVSLIPILEANELCNSRPERSELTGQLSLGKKLKLQMEAKLVALNANGGLGSCQRGIYKCFYCDERMVTRNTLSLHLRTRHGKNLL